MREEQSFSEENYDTAVLLKLVSLLLSHVSSPCNGSHENPNCHETQEIPHVGTEKVKGRSEWLLDH